MYFLINPFQKHLKLYQIFYIIGYYHVNYDVINWQRIVEYLNTKEYTKIHVLNRAQLINDIFNIMLISHECHFMKCDEVYAYSATLFLKFLRYLSQETNFVAWYPMFKAFEYLSRAFPLSNMTNVKVNRFRFPPCVICIRLFHVKLSYFKDDYQMCDMHMTYDTSRLN